MSSDCVYSPIGPGETEHGPPVYIPSDRGQGHEVQRLYPELPLTDENTAQSNVGSSTVGRGSSTVGRGSSTVGHESSTVGCGSSTVGRGSPTVGRGSSTVGRGSSTVGRGSPTVGRGSSTVGRGSSTVGRGSPTVGSGSWKQTDVSQPPHQVYSESPVAVGSDSRKQTAASQYPCQHRAQVHVPMDEQYPSIPPVVPLEGEGIPQLHVDVAPGNNIPPSTYINDPHDEGNMSQQGASTTEAGTDYWEGSTSGVIFDSKSKANDNNISVGNSDRSMDGNDFDRDRQRSLDASEGGPSASGSSMSSNYDEIGDNESRDTAFKNDNQVFRKKGIDADWVTNVDDLYEKACEKYVYFWKKDMVFSQWHWSVFLGEGGQQFNCAEQYMMFRKAEIFDDYPIGQKILRAKHPPKIKALGRKVHNFDEDVWSSQCLHIVKQANIAKFSQNSRMKEKLFNTYGKLLAEASPVDAVWGIGHDKYDEQAWDETKWRGRNLLGYILTEVRDELMCDEGIIQEEDKKVYLQKLQDENNAIQRKRRQERRQEQEGTPV